MVTCQLKLQQLLPSKKQEMPSAECTLLELEDEGVHADCATYANLLRKCRSDKALPMGQRVHASIVRSGLDRNTFLANLLVQMYGNCGRLESACAVFDSIYQRNVFSWNMMITAFANNGHLQQARSLFDTMPIKDVVSWNEMIAVYVQDGQAAEAIEIFRAMQLEGVQTDKVTFLSVVDACANARALADGKIIHGDILENGLESDVAVSTSLVDMYGKCRSLERARDVFDRMPQRNVVSWTAMISAFSLNGDLGNASRLFEEMPHRNVVSWNVMIAAYAQNGHGKAALRHFTSMDLEGMQPDKITFVNVLDACGSIGAQAEGRIIHGEIADSDLKTDMILGTALLNMYGKCGNMADSRATFQMMPQRNVVSWNAMLATYAQNGHNQEAFELFQLMELEGVKPDEVSYISILSVCSHVGLLKAGRCYFVSIDGDHGIMPIVEHYRCMIDLLGRAGHLQESEDLLKNMPFEPDSVAWVTLLAACKLHGDQKRAAVAAKAIPPVP